MIATRRPTSGRRRRNPLSLVFEDPETEREYRQSYFAKSLPQLRHGIILGIFLFLAFLPFDYLVFGDGQITRPVLYAALMRILVVLLFSAVLWLTFILDRKHTQKLTITGWFIAFLGMWSISAQPGTMIDTGYIYSLILIILASTIYLPFLFVHSLTLQPVLGLTFVHAYLMEIDRSGVDAANFLYPVLVNVAAAFMGLYAKYYSELSERRNFAQDRDLRDAQSRAEAASRAKSQFLAMVSHELRTPLNGIVGNLRIARGGGSKHDIDDALADAERSGLAMRNIVNDVLDLTRLEAEQPNQSVNRPFWLKDVIDDIEGAVKVTAQTKGLYLELPPADMLHVGLIGDAGRLRHILLNLVGNAVKFTQVGGVKIDFTIGDGEIIFKVSDSGIGIPSEQIEHVFDDFFRASNARECGAGGTGLGLAIVRRMVSECGGSVSIKSKVDQGTEVVFTVPFATALVLPPKSGDECEAETVGRSLRILVAEDEPVNMAVLRRFLVADGHVVVEATTGQAALDLFKPGELDCVLSDIHLPDMKGTELTKRLIGRMGSGRRVPVVAVTANVFPEDLRSYKEAGLHRVITKPVDRGELFQVLRELCVRSHQPSEHSQAGKLSERSKRLEALIGSEEFAEVLTAFGVSLRQSVDEIERARVEGAFDRIRFHAHKVAGSAASIGFDELASCARRLEVALVEQRSPADAEIETMLAAAEEVLREKRLLSGGPTNILLTSQT